MLMCVHDHVKHADMQDHPEVILCKWITYGVYAFKMENVFISICEIGEE
jgi:hypothetical protein